ncbi:MAG: dioxygenase [Methanobacterium sp.]|nr:dioxygenase [Methanobacterium sp.]
MMSKPIPPIFISHGAPSLPLEDIPARNFIKELGIKYKNVKAVLCISAHWETSIPEVTTNPWPNTIHDFYGFPEELYQIKYWAPGSPELAKETYNLIEDNGLEALKNHDRGLDHGTWIPMMLMFPEADVPVIQLSLQHHMDPEKHMHVGAQPDPWAIDFEAWLTRAVTTGDEESLLNYRRISPYPERAHPYPDHLMPLMTVFGAADNQEGKVAHKSWYAGDLGMGAYIFDD